MGILNSFSLEGKTAIVTGCKRGIGKAMAIGLAEAGANIIGVSASLELEDSEVEKAVQATENHSKPISVILVIVKRYTRLSIKSKQIFQ